MEDKMVRALAKEIGVRAIICDTTQLAREAAQRHGTSPTATYALAEVLTAASLMGALLKVKQRVALKFEGNGPVGKILAESDSYGRIRGFVANPVIDAPESKGVRETAAALGNVGLLTVVKDVQLKELPESVVPLGGQAIDTELTLYLTQSEQIPSLVVINVRLDDAGNVALASGLLLQNMPDHSIDALRQLSERLQELPPLATMLESGKSLEAILAELFGDAAYTVLEHRDLRFQCNCSRQRTEMALVAMGKEELENLLAEQGEATVDCQYCRRQYHFSREDLEDLLVELA